MRRFYSSRGADVAVVSSASGSICSCHMPILSRTRMGTILQRGPRPPALGGRGSARTTAVSLRRVLVVSIVHNHTASGEERQVVVQPDRDGPPPSRYAAPPYPRPPLPLATGTPVNTCPVSAKMIVSFPAGSGADTESIIRRVRMPGRTCVTSTYATLPSSTGRPNSPGT
jgi:hypothetical protein